MHSVKHSRIRPKTERIEFATAIVGAQKRYQRANTHTFDLMKWLARPKLPQSLSLSLCSDSVIFVELAVCSMPLPLCSLFFTFSYYFMVRANASLAQTEHTTDILRALHIKEDSAQQMLSVRAKTVLRHIPLSVEPGLFALLATKHCMSIFRVHKSIFRFFTGLPCMCSPAAKRKNFAHKEQSVAAMTNNECKKHSTSDNGRFECLHHDPTSCKRDASIY